MIYATNPQSIRESMDLAYKIPEGYETLGQLDAECERLHEIGRLVIVNSESINANMQRIKNPELGIPDFRNIAHIIISQLAQEVARQPLDSRKVGISVRAGLAFLLHSMKFMPEAEVGFATQTRDEETAKCASNGDKLGDFTGKHAILFDPMLATGGSLTDLIVDVTDRGATGVTTVTAFTAPQGLVAVSMHPNVQRMITTPLEAGLNENAYIVGGHQPHAMLGDFGDRYFGSVNEN